MKRTPSAILSTILACLSFALQAQSEQSPADLLELREAAEFAYISKNAATAEKLFTSLVAGFPDDPEAWLGLSHAHEWMGNLDGAIETAKHARQLGYVSNANLSYRLAQLNAQAGNTEEALAWIKQALEDRYENRPNIQSDETLASLHDSPEFRTLAAVVPANKMSRTEGLRFDIDYLVEEAKRMHAGPTRPAFSARFEETAEELSKSVPELSDAEYLGGAMKLLSMLGDGHSAIYGPDTDSPLQIVLKFLPLKFYWFAEGVYVVDGIGRNAEFAGSRVLKIADLPVEELLMRLSELRGVDNDMTWKWMGPQFYLGQLQMLQLVGVMTSADGVRLTLEDRNGRVDEYEFAGIDQPSQRKLRPSPAARGDVPMYLTNIDSNYWMQSLPEHRAVYFQFNQVRDDKDVTIAEFADSLLARLTKEVASTLIVDVRHNNGGNNYLLRPLIRAMIAFEQITKGNQVYVITGRNTFSAAQNFINRTEQWTDAIFVGEPSASRPNFAGEETNLLLPYSRLRGSISTRYWQDSNPGDERAWIVPMVRVEPTAEDYFAGNDAALEAVLGLITN